MTKKTISDEARELCDIATLLAVDLGAQLVVNGLGGMDLLTHAMGVREMAKQLASMVDGANVGRIEIPARSVSPSGCSEVLDSVMSSWTKRKGAPHRA